MNHALVVVVAVVAAAFGGLLVCECKCDIKGIFNFGDSNSDTGGFFAAFPTQNGPFGITYFHKPVGRATDGRVIVDFLAQAIGIPFISPYLKSIGSDYKNGANFATLASTVLMPNTSMYVTGVSPFFLAIQLNQLKELYSKVINNEDSTSLPSVDIFGKALYTFYIGQNDFTGNLHLGINVVKQLLPQVISQIVYAIKEVYGIGGRTFWVLNLAPVGCYPSLLVDRPPESSNLDEFGCSIAYNDAVKDYNNMLKEALQQTRPDVPDASLVYVDTHSVLLDLIQHPTSYGMKYGVRACCGQGGGPYNFNHQVYCGNTKVINGSILTTTVCEDPSKYVSWDGIHSSDAANKLITLAILNGSIFDPPFPLNHICDLQHIG